MKRNFREPNKTEKFLSSVLGATLTGFPDLYQVLGASSRCQWFSLAPWAVGVACVPVGRSPPPGRKARQADSATLAPIHAPWHSFRVCVWTTRRTTGSQPWQLLKVPAWLRRGLDDFPFIGRIWTFTDVDREEAQRCWCHRTLAPTRSCGEEGSPGRPHGLLSAHRPLPGRLPPNQARKARCQLSSSQSQASGWAWTGRSCLRWRCAQGAWAGQGGQLGGLARPRSPVGACGCGGRTQGGAPCGAIAARVPRSPAGAGCGNKERG